MAAGPAGSGRRSSQNSEEQQRQQRFPYFVDFVSLVAGGHLLTQRFGTNRLSSASEQLNIGNELHLPSLQVYWLVHWYPCQVLQKYPKVYCIPV